MAHKRASLLSKPFPRTGWPTWPGTAAVQAMTSAHCSVGANLGALGAHCWGLNSGEGRVLASVSLKWSDRDQEHFWWDVTHAAEPSSAWLQVNTCCNFCNWTAGEYWSGETFLAINIYVWAVYLYSLFICVCMGYVNVSKTRISIFLLIISHGFLSYSLTFFFQLEIFRVSQVLQWNNADCLCFFLRCTLSWSIPSRERIK